MDVERPLYLRLLGLENVSRLCDVVLTAGQCINVAPTSAVPLSSPKLRSGNGSSGACEGLTALNRSANQHCDGRRTCKQTLLPSSTQCGDYGTKKDMSPSNRKA